MTRADRRPRQRLNPAQRRAAILDAARDAFAHAPYDQVSLASVAGAAGASEALVHKYFATKGGLYAEIVREAIGSLLQRQREADAALGPAATARQRLAASVEAYLDFVASAPEGWAAPLRDPCDGAAEAASLRAQARERYVTLLRAVLGLPPGQPRDHALHGYLGFLDAACLSWVTAGCPPGQRPALTAAALGALDGALAALPPARQPGPYEATQATRPDQVPGTDEPHHLSGSAGSRRRTPALVGKPRRRPQVITLCNRPDVIVHIPVRTSIVWIGVQIAGRLFR